MTDQLFDPAPYGGATERRAKVEKPSHPLVHVRGQWELLGSLKVRPLAHVLDQSVELYMGSRKAICGTWGRYLTVDGEPVAPACLKCLDLIAANDDSQTA